MAQTGFGEGGYNLLHTGLLSLMRILFFFIVVKDTAFLCIILMLLKSFNDFICQREPV